MFTLEQLTAMPAGTIFARGTAIDEPGGLFMARTGKALRWVAVRGYVNDWCIYCYFDGEQDDEWIRRQGDKVHGDEHIRKLVKCDDAMFARYRH